MNTPKIIIAGGREFSDEFLMKKALKYHISEWGLESAIIVSGAARGADRLGEKIASKYRLEVRRFPADWDTYGKSAGYKRNVEMAEYATHLIAFWDTNSRGTKHMIDVARNKGLHVVVVLY